MHASQALSFSDPNLAKHCVAQSCSPRQLPRQVMPLRQAGLVKHAWVGSLHWLKKHEGSAFILPPCSANSSNPAVEENSAAVRVATSAASAAGAGGSSSEEEAMASVAAAFGSHGVALRLLLP